MPRQARRPGSRARWESQQWNSRGTPDSGRFRQVYRARVFRVGSPEWSKPARLRTWQDFAGKSSPVLWCGESPLAKILMAIRQSGYGKGSYLQGFRHAWRQKMKKLPHISPIWPEPQILVNNTDCDIYVTIVRSNIRGLIRG